MTKRPSRGAAPRQQPRPKVVKVVVVKPAGNTPPPRKYRCRSTFCQGRYVQRTLHDPYPFRTFRFNTVTNDWRCTSCGLSDYLEG